MTDDLVKRMRKCPYGSLMTDKLLSEAADRIEALTEQLKTVLDREAATTSRYDGRLDGLQDRLDIANRSRTHVMGMALKKQHRIEALTEQLEAARRDAERQEARADAWRFRADIAEAKLSKTEGLLAKAVEALTPSGETKAAYIGEVETDCPSGRSHTVSWTATKDIMKMIRHRAELKGPPMTKDDELIRRGDALASIYGDPDGWTKEAIDTIPAAPSVQQTGTPPEVLALVEALRDAVDALETHHESGDAMQGYWLEDARAALAAWEARNGIGKAFDDDAEELRAKLKWSDVEDDDA